MSRPSKPRCPSRTLGAFVVLLALATTPTVAQSTFPLERAVRVFSAAGGEVELDAMLDELGKADVVFCGETHLDDVTHRVELALYEGLLRRREGKVVLSLEMFSTDVQAVLDDYVAGRVDEPTFLARSNPWSNYATGYRALVERARRDRLPVVAANAPRALLRKVGMGGLAALEALPPAERKLLPPELLPNSEAYWRRVEHATRGHVGGGGTNSPEQLLVSTQSLWDNTMGWSCARALERFPGCLVLHVVGGFHTAYGDGTASQLARRKPEAKVRTVQIEPTADLVDAEARSPAADFTVRALRRARGLDRGFHAVTVARELRYRLHVPSHARGPLPLLLWLPAGGLRAEDGLELWQAALGEDAVVAVVEAPYAQLEADLGRGGKWFWGDSFEDDTATLAEGIGTLRRYVQAHFPIDPQRILLAGEGEGATVVASAALWGDDVAPAVLAFGPRGYRKLAERGLPDDPIACGKLRVLASGAHAEWWQNELAQHAHRKPDAAVVAEGDAVALVREHLALPARSVDEPPTFVVRAGASPRARAWHALARVAAGAAEVVVLPPEATGGETQPDARALALLGEWPAALEQALVARGVRFFSPADAAAAGLPPAPGPFGGTTILVLPAGTPAAVREAWEAVAAAEPMGRYGRFYRLALAAAEGEGTTLGDALAAMVAAGRSNALVVPAAFCAEPATMQALQRAAEPWADRVEITWSPGLGGRLATAAKR